MLMKFLTISAVQSPWIRSAIKLLLHAGLAICCIGSIVAVNHVAEMEIIILNAVIILLTVVGSIFLSKRLTP